MEEITKCPKNISSPTLEQNNENFDEIFQHLPQVKTHHGILGQFQGIWFDAHVFQSVMSVHKHFQAKDTDVFLATIPKSGTTWLKALTYAIINRGNHSVDQSTLLFSNPHQLIPFLENSDAFTVGENAINLGQPRIFSTHIPYQCLPKSILVSKSKIIYLCRNPLDVFTSTMAFAAENELVKLAPMGVEFQLFHDGIQSYGPFWDHILGYWNQSLKKIDGDHQKVLFLRYEDLKKDINSGAKKMAEFLGFPFSVEEEKNGVIEDITRLCSFENLKNLEVNMKGATKTFLFTVKNSSFFRKGEVGDWKNSLTPSMANQLEKLMEEKFAGSGFALEFHSKEDANECINLCFMN